MLLFLVSGAIYLVIALLGRRGGRGAGAARVRRAAPVSAAATRVLFDEPGPRGRARIRIFTVIGLLLVAGIVALALYQFYRNGQLGRSRWLAFAEPAYLRFLADGIRGTIIATAVAAVLSFPLGVVLALGRLSRNGLLRRVSTWYIELFRSIPLLLLIYAFLLALPRYGINLPILWKLVVPIVLVNVAVLAEIFRAGILAVDRGQSEAAAALGLREGPAMRSVILPQAIRLVIPTLVTQLVALLKDSTLGYVVSYPELMKQAQNLTVYTHLLVQTYLDRRRDLRGREPAALPVRGLAGTPPRVADEQPRGPRAGGGARGRPADHGVIDPAVTELLPGQRWCHPRAALASSSRTRAATHRGRRMICAAVNRSTVQPAALRYACRSRSRIARSWVRCASPSYSIASRIPG